MKHVKLYENNEYDVTGLITSVFFGDDWSGLYIEDTLIDDGHSVRLDNVLEHLIKNDVRMGDYKLTSLMLHKDGKVVDGVTEDECEDMFGCEMPQSLSEYIEKCRELGYDVNI